jgi:G3E family GTPase
MAAVLADSASVWRRLLAIARASDSPSRQSRRDALFWLGQFAAAKLDGHGEDIAATQQNDHDDRDDARSTAVFALSQLKDRQGIDPLVQVARTTREPHLRRKALFWLADSGDPRAVALFAEILGR